MSFILNFLNGPLGTAFIAAVLLEIIRQRYQQSAKENAQKVEWLKQTREEQTKLFNELSTLTASVVGDSQMLFKALADSMKGSAQDEAELKERENALLNSILTWEQSHLSIRNRIQQLTHLDPSLDSKAVKLFMGDFRTDISEMLAEKIVDETTLAAAISILCNKTLNSLTLFREKVATPVENGETTDDSAQSPVSFGLSANIATGAAMPSEDDSNKPEPAEITKLSENEREQRLSSCRDKITQLNSSKDEMMKWLWDRDEKATVLCDATNKYLLEHSDKKNYTALLRLEMQKDMLGITERVDNKIHTFFKKLNLGFQEHLDTVDKRIVK
ncbi:MAG: hypothetical protein DRR19_20960 [Candidatus Parabeggiatoa sp. nov. 1]|nr:MAG: hypothetical protein DRR19_20960 [Gammaproteobacteria bacterium]